jgi:hypothetical protein
MIQDKLVFKITDYFDSQLAAFRSDPQQMRDLYEFYSATNYYSILRSNFLEQIYDLISTKEVLSAVIFDSMPRILFLFKEEQLSEIINQIAMSFSYWSALPNSNQADDAPIANRLFIEEAYFDKTWIIAEIHREKWILIVCLFFLYFHKTNTFKEITDFLNKTKKPFNS